MVKKTLFFLIEILIKIEMSININLILLICLLKSIFRNKY